MSQLLLKEIAQQAEVSPALVSQILNGKDRASDAVRKKVQRMLEKNGYRPRYARTPFYYIVDLPRVEAAGKTHNVLQQLSGIEAAFEIEQLSLHVEFIRSAPTQDQLKAIVERKPSGIFLNTDTPFLNDACKIFSEAGVPLVQIGYDTENPDYHAVVLDSFAGAYMATRRLLQNGHQRIAILRWVVGVSAINSNKKFAGYQAALADVGLAMDESLVVSYAAEQGDPDWQPVIDLVTPLLELAQPPTALFVENSFISMPLLYALPDAEQFSRLADWEIIHFEDWNLRPVHDIVTGKLFQPPLQTQLIGIDWERIGQQAARLLLEQIRQQFESPQILRVSPALYLVNGDQRTVIS